MLLGLRYAPQYVIAGGWPGRGSPWVMEIMPGEACMNIYVGGLSYDATEADLREAFEAFGAVSSVTIIKDQFSGQSRGFGFVEMPTTSEAQAAISGLNGKELRGRTLNVNEARPRTGTRTDRRPGGGQGGRRRF
jgi:RNA recognition motif-containing protein